MLFCSNSLQSMVRVDNQLGEVQIKRQRLLRETKFIDALAGILSVTITTLEERELVKTIKSELVSPLDVPASPLFKKESKETNIEVVKMKLLLPVVENVYKLLSAICKDNKDTQTYTYQYFRIFIKHIGLDL